MIEKARQAVTTCGALKNAAPKARPGVRAHTQDHVSEPLRFE
jgi:hypothetical protein